MKLVTLFALAASGLGILVGCNEQPAPVQQAPAPVVVPTSVSEDTLVSSAPKATLPDFKALSVKLLLSLDKAHSAHVASRPVSTYDHSLDDAEEAKLQERVTVAKDKLRDARDTSAQPLSDSESFLQELYLKLERLIESGLPIHKDILDHSGYPESEYDPSLANLLNARVAVGIAELELETAEQAIASAKALTDKFNDTVAQQRKDIAEASRVRSRARTAYNTVVERIRAMEASKPRAPTPPAQTWGEPWARYIAARDRYTQDMQHWRVKVDAINAELAVVTPAKTAAEANYEEVKEREKTHRQLGIDARQATSAAKKLLADSEKAKRAADLAYTPAKVAFDKAHEAVKTKLKTTLEELALAESRRDAAIASASAEVEEATRMYQEFVTERDDRKEMASKALRLLEVDWENLDKELLRIIKWADSLGSLSDVQAISDRLRELRSFPGVSADTIIHINDAVRTLTVIR